MQTDRSFLVVGRTGSGKTCWIQKRLRQPDLVNRPVFFLRDLSSATTPPGLNVDSVVVFDDCWPISSEQVQRWLSMVHHIQPQLTAVFVVTQHLQAMTPRLRAQFDRLIDLDEIGFQGESSPPPPRAGDGIYRSVN